MGGLNKSMSGTIKDNCSIFGVKETNNKERHFRRKTRN